MTRDIMKERNFKKALNYLENLTRTIQQMYNI